MSDLNGYVSIWVNLKSMKKVTCKTKEEKDAIHCQGI